MNKNRVPFAEIPDNISIQILYCLHQNGRMVKSVLYSRLEKSNKTIQPRVDEMVATGLISETIEERPPKRKWVELTEKGRKVAEKLEEIEGILGG
ncbi:MAG: hypothetical protein HPY73_05650 [Methanomassiliicoccales archaeon]|nr:MAG: hypothetical protein HPY73_05650 [Methanomassiliicoccales archaeon]